MTRYRIRKTGRRWLIITPSGRRFYCSNWPAAVGAVDRRIARKRDRLTRTTQADYALAASGDTHD